jgi:MurNAc alpha-1-phosphate uridylyltransferase
MKALIFAAGLGTRLKPLTDTLPKALIPVSGHPLLYHVIMKLKSAGITDIVINVHHFADKIIEYLQVNDNFGLNISISDERDFLRETGGGIRYAKSLLRGGFMVHNVDIISNLDIRKFDSDMVSGAMAMLLVSERITQRYFLFDDTMRLVGWTNIATGQVKSPYRSIEVESCHKLAFGGIHLISDEIFDAFDQVDANPSSFPLYDKEGKIIEGTTEPLGEKFSITDFYLRVAAKYPIYANAPKKLRLIDVGKVDTLAQVEQSGLL